MPSYFALWKLNSATPPPPDPAAGVQLLEGLLAQMQAQLQAGLLKEVHEFLGGGSGYLITGDHPAEKVAETLATWAPWIEFEVHQTIKFPKPLEIAIAVAKQQAAATKR